MHQAALAVLSSPIQVSVPAARPVPRRKVEDVGHQYYSGVILCVRKISTLKHLGSVSSGGNSGKNGNCSVVLFFMVRRLAQPPEMQDIPTPKINVTGLAARWTNVMGSRGKGNGRGVHEPPPRAAQFAARLTKIFRSCQLPTCQGPNSWKAQPTGSELHVTHVTQYPHVPFGPLPRKYRTLIHTAYYSPLETMSIPEESSMGSPTMTTGCLATV